jgi:cobyrinic acid a,c-diamide synthase
MKTHLVAKISAYLEGKISLKELVNWAEELILNGFEANPVESEIIYRLGVADAENFELSWEELAHMLKQLGYKVRLQLQVM